jgi:dynein heavy chain 1
MLAAKVVPLFRLCKDQLSPCTHYDFGLRALKSVLVGAGGIKRRADAESSESQLVLQSFCGSIVPKLIPEDIPMFYALLSDVFPGSNLPHSTSDEVRLMLLTVCEESHFSPENDFITKVMQLSEIARLHHGIMLVGPPGSGKTSSWRLLFEALKRIETNAPSPHFYVINPKALTKAALFGHLDATTREWSDGVLTSILRKVVAGQRGDQNNGRHWIVLDGDVDPEWVENLNSVLDDNKMLTLPNGERLALPDNVRILFEVEDLRYATPATVSRCGMIWFGASNVRPDMQVRRSIACLSSGIDPSSAISSAQMMRQQPALAMTDRECWSSLESILSQGDLLTRAFAHAGGLEHVMPFSAHQAADSFISLLRGAVSELTAFVAESGEDTGKGWIKGFLEKHVALSLAWALGGSLPASTRSSMSSWINENSAAKCPTESTLYDWEVRNRFFCMFS